jgi:hypothetical protein
VTRPSSATGPSAPPGHLWHLEATGLSGEQVRLRLRDEHGNDLGASSATERAALFDLALAPGMYEVAVFDAAREDYDFRLQG